MVTQEWSSIAAMPSRPSSAEEREDYARRQIAAGFSVGDTVRVFAYAPDFSSGWGTVWVAPMDDFINNGAYRVESIHSHNGIRLCDVHDERGLYSFPYFVLEKVDATGND